MISSAEILTKDVNPNPCINWTEESIEKLNKPPRDKECHSDWKQNHTTIADQIYSTNQGKIKKGFIE